MQINLTFKHFKKGEEKLARNLKKYAEEKFKKVEEVLPNHAKKSAKLDATLDESGKKTPGYKFKFDVKLRLPGKSLRSSFNANTAEQAVNKAERKLVQQLNKYKTQHHTDKRMDKKTLAKLRRILKRG
ncbi:MAG: Sigma 54 modulation protein / ribosomal protein [Patescibacteria group bacterium]|nr:Sigma 54 modulation protein / ribosomal protein [Patescibacteria group bacterium]